MSDPEATRKGLRAMAGAPVYRSWATVRHPDEPWVDYAPLIRADLVEYGWVPGVGGWIDPDEDGMGCLGHSLLRAVDVVAGPAEFRPDCKVTEICLRLTQAIGLPMPDPWLFDAWEEMPERTAADIDALLARTDLVL